MSGLEVDGAGSEASHSCFLFLSPGAPSQTRPMQMQIEVSVLLSGYAYALVHRQWVRMYAHTRVEAGQRSGLGTEDPKRP